MLVYVYTQKTQIRVYIYMRKKNKTSATQPR
nr:MAG TPA: hypothetical protein [Caudoviricetes sp.]